MSVTRAGLTQREYEQLRRATETHREELVVRLCGEVGLRAAEITRLRPADFDEEQGGGGEFLTVQKGDSGTRTAYAPEQVAHDFQQYVRSNDVDDDEPVVDVTPRRIQMLVRGVGARAARETGRAMFEEVTPSALRQWFGRRLLVEHGVDVRVVMAVGGWQGVDSLVQSTAPPTSEEIAAAFERLDSTPRDAGRLARVVVQLESVDEKLIGASTHEEIDQRVCTQLTEVYRAAWITELEPSRDRVTVRTHAGESPDRFDDAADTGIIRRVRQTGRTLVAPDDPGPASDHEGRGLLAAIPIAHDQTGYGVLVVRGAGDAFDDPERTALTALGRRIAFAITATERKLLLLGGTVLELGLQYSDPEATLARLSASLDCTLTLDGVVPGERGSLVCFLEARKTSAERALETAMQLSGIGDARLIQRDEDGGLLEVVLQADSPLLALAGRGGTVTDLHIESGRASLVCELAPESDVRTVHEELRRQFQSVELRSKQERQATRDSVDLHETVEDQLTDKQRAVLRGAYHAGYFEWPRESTAEDLAEALGISPPTLHNHLRKAQGKLLGTVFEDEYDG